MSYESPHNAREKDGEWEADKERERERSNAMLSFCLLAGGMTSLDYPFCLSGRRVALTPLLLALLGGYALFA